MVNVKIGLVDYPSIGWWNIPHLNTRNHGANQIKSNGSCTG
ncbi:MAG TPA: hypothetical protein VJI98_03780 [Candidatus Nanoarchaeia archaeon]|nr:hypothetical protein [Candidatus Nanoarchaeia archaeon]